MHRVFPYLLLFAVAALLQVFLFNNLALSVYFNPLVYLVFLVLLPMETPPAGVLLAALAMGLTMDWTMGAAGLNTASLLPVAMMRLRLLQAVGGRENIRLGGVPSPMRLGAGNFLRYLVVLVAAQHLLFFLLETLSWQQLGHTLLRFAVSSVAAVVFVWLLARLFTAKLAIRV